MQIEEYCWNRSASAHIFGKLWFPGDSMRVLIVMVHGIGEHSGCYQDWAEKFVRSNIGFLSFDLRGHGRSSGKRGHAAEDRIIEDLKMVLKYMKNRFPGIPVVLYGHSMGGNIVLTYAIGKGVSVQGIIASSPWLRLVNPPAEGLVRIARTISFIVPSLTVKTGVRSSDLSRVDTGKSTKTDPLMHKKISIKLFTDLSKNGDLVIKSKHRVNVPLLLMHGSDDRLTSCQASKSFACNAGTFTKFKEWKGMCHDLHNDPNNESVCQYILKWISNRVEINPNEKLQNSHKIFRVA